MQLGHNDVLVAADAGDHVAVGEDHWPVACTGWIGGHLHHWPCERLDLIKGDALIPCYAHRFQCCKYLLAFWY